MFLWSDHVHESASAANWGDFGAGEPLVKGAPEAVWINPPVEPIIFLLELLQVLDTFRK
jgi:hypothetical protein